MILQVHDYSQTLVILSKTTWHNKLLDPIFGHPEVQPMLVQIKKTITKPDFVFQSIRDPRSKLFITKITHGEFISYFLVVVVKYVKEQNKNIGYVSTVMINRKLPKTNKLIWEKKVST